MSQVGKYRGLRRVRFELYFFLMWTHAWVLKGRSTRRAYFSLKNSEFLNRDQLDQLQLQRLKEILKHAYNTTEFYRDRLDSVGLNPESIESEDSSSFLQRIPLLSKQDVRTNLDSKLSSTAVSISDRLTIHTSGSTGEPFTIYADRNQLEVRFAATLRALEQTGWKFGDKQVRLWHQTLGMTRSQVVRERIDAKFLRRKFIPAFEMSADNIETFIQVIRNYQPVLVDGYAESLNFLASYVRSGRVAGFSPVAVMSSAQALPQSTRTIIETGLKCRVFDKYGSREFSGIAYECSAHKHHHVVDECYIVEILVDGRPAREGEIGEIVITDLFNRATPLIRYRIGDLAVCVRQEKCSCGRSHSTLGEIEGRTQAIVHCADGTWIPGTFFAHFFKDYETVIRLFQVVQEVKGKFRLLIVKNDRFDQLLMEDIISKLREYVGETHIDVELVEEIPMVRTGKRSPVVSSVREDFQEVSGTSIQRAGEEN